MASHGRAQAWLISTSTRPLATRSRTDLATTAVTRRDIDRTASLVVESAPVAVRTEANRPRLRAQLASMSVITGFRGRPTNALRRGRRFAPIIRQA
jgi:hypothetical protein